MTFAELAKRFENASLSDVTITPPAIPVGRVRELTRRLEQAVEDTGTPEIPFGETIPAEDTQDSNLAQLTEEIPHDNVHEDVQVDAVIHPEEEFPSPPPLPTVSGALSGASHEPSSQVLSTASANLSAGNQSFEASATLQSPSTPAQNIIRNHIPSGQHSPEKLTLQQRLARYEELTSPTPTPPPPPDSHHPTLPLPTSPPPFPQLSSPQGPSKAPRTPSTEFSTQTSSSSSEQRVELIPDVSEGDLDDIEGVERVDDEERVDDATSTTDTFDGDTTFHRAQTIETLPSEQQSYHTLPGVRPPSNPATPSNASENSSFSSAEFASATEEFHQDRPAPHTLAVPSAPRMQSNLSTQPHTLQIAPGSFKKLPKAKVMIARRRPDDEAGTSHDDASGRRLIRTYENPKELLEGNVSLVELSDDDENVEFRDPEISDVRRDTSIRKKHRADAFRHRYDEFMDVHEVERANEMADEDAISSKEKYPRRRLFRRGKVEKARQREERVARQREAVARRSTVISGALDRVSLAADPFIDFITDNNTLPAAKAGGLRRGLKRLFGFGRPNAGLIKNRE